MSGFKGTEGGIIKLSDAAALTARYRQQNSDATKGHFFGKKILREILQQRGCVGIRIYYGQEENGVKKLILSGVMANKDDMLGLLADFALPCPDQCGTSNALNS